MTNEQLLQVASDIYDYIIDETDGPKDGAQIILMLHVRLWLNYRDSGVATDTMLKKYCSGFQQNFDLNYKAQFDA